LHDEVENFVKSLNSWKIEKLSKNLAMFKKYMYLLDDQNTKQVGHALMDSYNLSARGKKALSKRPPRTKSAHHMSSIVQVSSKIKAMFVFQATEFCNGGDDRMKVIDFARLRSTIVRKLTPSK
jgi:RAB protein geranylgeranyltransferase component A